MDLAYKITTTKDYTFDLEVRRNGKRLFLMIKFTVTIILEMWIEVRQMIFHLIIPIMKIQKNLQNFAI